MELIIIHVNEMGKMLSSLPAGNWVFIDKKIRTLLFANTLPFASLLRPALWSCTLFLNGANLPNERKGYFLHHTPLTTTSARSCHVLDKAKHKAASRKTTSHSHQLLNPESTGAIRLCGQDPSSGYDSWTGSAWEVFYPRSWNSHLGGGAQWHYLKACSAVFCQTTREAVRL